MIISYILTESTNTLSNSFNEVEIIWIPIIVAILSSSVIVGVFQFIQWNKNKKLENITVERKTWRDDMRKIVEELQCSTDDNSLQLALAKLKVRINPKGMFLKNNKDMNLVSKYEYFEEDGYLWEIIKMIENTPEFENKKSYILDLVELISVLIKFDWDRARSEVRFSNLSKAKFWFYLLFTCILVHFILIIFLKHQIYFTLPSLVLYILYPLCTAYKRYKVTIKIDQGVSKKWRWLHLNNQTTSFILYLLMLILFVIAFDSFECYNYSDFLLMSIQGSCSILSILFYVSSTYYYSILKCFSGEYYYMLTNKILNNAKNRNKKKN